MWTYFDIFEKVFKLNNFIICKENICLREGDQCQNVPWSIVCLTSWWNLLGLIRESCFGCLQFVNTFV